MRGGVGSTWIIDGGDGDQAVFGSRLVARRVEETWFSGELPRGEAYLLQVQEGSLAGQYLAVTSRLVASLSEQLQLQRWISVVVHTIEEPGPGFEPTLAGANAVGMAVVEVL